MKIFLKAFFLWMVCYAMPSAIYYLGSLEYACLFIAGTFLAAFIKK